MMYYDEATAAELRDEQSRFVDTYLEGTVVEIYRGKRKARVRWQRYSPNEDMINAKTYPYQRQQDEEKCSFDMLWKIKEGNRKERLAWPVCLKEDYCSDGDVSDYGVDVDEADEHARGFKSKSRRRSRRSTCCWPDFLDDLNFPNLECPSSRARMGICEPFTLKLDEEATCMDSVLNDYLIDGQEIIGTAAEKNGPVRDLTKPAHTVCRSGRPYLVLADGTYVAVAISRCLEVGLALMSYDAEHNLAAFECVGPLLRKRERYRHACRFIDRALPEVVACRALHDALEHAGASDKSLIHVSLFAGALDGGHEAVWDADNLLVSVSIEACRTCCAFQKARDEIRGGDTRHVILNDVMGERGDSYLMDIGDGKGLADHAVTLPWGEKLHGRLSEIIDDACARANVARDDVHVHVTATPPCNGVSYMNAAEGFMGRRAEGMKLTKATLHNLRQYRHDGLVDSFFIENVRPVLFMWNTDFEAEAALPRPEDDGPRKLVIPAAAPPRACRRGRRAAESVVSSLLEEAGMTEEEICEFLNATACGLTVNDFWEGRERGDHPLMLRGFNLQRPWASMLLLDGSKIIEARTYDIGGYGGEWFWVIETPGKQRRPRARITGCIKFSTETIRYTSLEQWRADEGRHRIAAGSDFDWDGRGAMYGWRVEHVMALRATLPAPKKGMRNSKPAPRLVPVNGFAF